jgi:hypothetical protein
MSGLHVELGTGRGAHGTEYRRESELDSHADAKPVQPERGVLQWDGPRRDRNQRRGEWGRVHPLVDLLAREPHVFPPEHAVPDEPPDAAGDPSAEV